MGDMIQHDDGITFQNFQSHHHWCQLPITLLSRELMTTSIFLVNAELPFEHLFMLAITAS